MDHRGLGLWRISSRIVLWLILTVGLRAQDASFRAGQVVSVPDGGSQREGRVVRQDASGVLVRFPMYDGRWDEVHGPTRYYRPAELRDGTALPAPIATPSPAPAPPPGPGGSGPMTQAEVLAYLRQRIGGDPWGHPDKSRTVAELAALIRRRGVDFRFDILSAFADELRNSGGNETTIPFHLKENYGPPKPLDWLMGTWNLSVHATHTQVKGTRLVTTDTVAATDRLTLRPDRSYEWRTASGKVHKGTWRTATDAEMATKYAGGAGVVIEGGRDGWIWILHEFDPEPMPAETLAVGALGSSYKEFGHRAK